MGAGCWRTSTLPLQEHGVACARAENLELLRAGCCNLARHIENAKKCGVPVVVALNRFATDTDAELAVVREEALAAGGRGGLGRWTQA